MKIDQKIQYQTIMLNKTQNDTLARSAKESSPQAKSGEGAFSVTISKTAGNLVKATELMTKTVSSEDEIRRDRINAIKEQLAAGTYNISGKDVATKILNVLKG